MLEIIGLALWLVLLAFLLPQPWLAIRDYLAAIVILRVPLLVLGIAFLLHRNEQVREILAITCFSPGNSSHLAIAIVSYLLVASSLWFWSGIFCDFHTEELCRLRWARFIPSLIAGAFLAIVAFNVATVAPGAGVWVGPLIAVLTFAFAAGFWAVGDHLLRTSEAFASQDFRLLARSYLGSMGEYFGALADWLGSRVPSVNPAVAIVGALASVLLMPFVAAVLLLGWLSRSFNALTRMAVRLAGKPAVAPSPASTSKDEATGHPWWIDWIFWLDRSLARLNASYAAAISPAPLAPPEVARDATRPVVGIPGGLLRPPPNEIADLLRSSTPTLLSALVLASGPLAVAIAPEVVRTWLFQWYLYGVAGICVMLLACFAWAFFAGLLVPGCALLLFIVVPGLAIQTVGAVGVIAISNAFLLACLALFCLLWLLARAIGRPVMTILLASILLLSLLDLNDNHAIRTIERRDETEPSTWAEKSLLEAFDAWLAARKDAAGFTPDEYPVYIIAARGGGMYAAQHTARFLARAQDLYPSFAHHVFAVSAVSGGSIGASLFSALVSEREKQLAQPASSTPNGERWFETRANAFLDNDFLASVTAATLFRDTIARLVPCLDVWLWHFRLCPTAHLDRARAFEATLELTWDAQLRPKSNPFRDSFARHWDPAGDAPALLLNTTEVETGDRVVVAPFKLLNEDVPSLVSLAERAPKLHIALSTAAGLSARFPGIGSAGWYYAQTAGGTVKRRLVDGGYFDNSGGATALDVITIIRQRRPHVKLILIALTGADAETADAPGYGFGEILSPLRTLEGIRRTRAELAIELAHRTLDGSPCRIEPIRERSASCAHDGSVRQTVLGSGDQVLPLGWYLSRQSRDRIASSVGEPDRCNIVEYHQSASLRERLAAHLHSSNSCLLRKIGHELQGNKGKPR
jgi:hypothetical protein